MTASIAEGSAVVISLRVTSVGETMTKSVLIALMLSCDLLGGTALAKNVNGVPCRYDSECASDKCSYGICRPERRSASKQFGNGVRCSSDYDCASEKCSGGVCRPDRSTSSTEFGTGTRCQYSSDCASGRCISNVCKAR